MIRFVGFWCGDHLYLIKLGELKTNKDEQKELLQYCFPAENIQSQIRKGPIYCRITVNGQRTEFSIKRSLELSLWQNGKVKGNGEEARRVRSYLKQVEAKLFEHYRNLIADDTLLDADMIKNAYLGIRAEQRTLCELMEYHNTRLKDSLEWGTLKNYFTTQAYVKEFMETRIRKKDIILSQLNYQFITELEMFLRSYQPKDHRKPMGNNTVMKHM